MGDDQRIQASKKWLYELAAKLSITYQQLLDACEFRYNEPGEGTGFFPSSEIQEAMMDIDNGPSKPELAEMWKHWRVVTGREPKSFTDSPFECSC